MRKTLAADFHDETGNLLSAITRQATIQKLQVDDDPRTQTILEPIITNSNQLYNTSRHFLWHLNQNSDDPLRLIDYLTSLGQNYFPPLNISFSTHQFLAGVQATRHFSPFAAINLIFIFREAMTNVGKHAGASEVKLTLRSTDEPSRLEFALTDNGPW
ncbi:sensor histidine kinase [Larkinella insperata]|uniref:histidine kinase n=1 Tax=Larkinella insperata TaxID=332158 RepID=A0ABW3Q721_9BACT